MDLGLKEKTAPVLGGGGGLGRAIAKAFAAEGVNVGVAGIDSTSIDCTATDLKAIGGKCIGLTWDLADLSEVAAESHSTIPLGRYGKPEEYADVVVILASERAGYITGSVVRVDGRIISSI